LPRRPYVEGLLAMTEKKSAIAEKSACSHKALAS
jgi:hypothetical protein